VRSPRPHSLPSLSRPDECTWGVRSAAANDDHVAAARILQQAAGGASAGLGLGKGKGGSATSAVAAAAAAGVCGPAQRGVSLLLWLSTQRGAAINDFNDDGLTPVHVRARFRFWLAQAVPLSAVMRTQVAVAAGFTSMADLLYKCGRASCQESAVC
jgi:hypothetical protein